MSAILGKAGNTKATLVVISVKNRSLLSILLLVHVEYGS
jgi:hypothetical protein